MGEDNARVVWECPYWRVEESRYTGSDGRDRTWYTARRPNPNTVHMLGLTVDGQVPVLKQWRAPLGTHVWELPAGVCDVEGEAMMEAAARELEEETGYRPGEVHHLFSGTVSPGLTDELYHAYLCLDLQRVSEGGGTGGELIEVRHVPFRHLPAFLLALQRNGELVDAKVLTHVTLAMQRLVELASQDKETGETRYADLADNVVGGGSEQ